MSYPSHEALKSLGFGLSFIKSAYFMKKYLMPLSSVFSASEEILYEFIKSLK